MIRGMYASASSLAALLRRQSSLSQNLANMNTPGFKQEISLVEMGADRGLLQLPRGAAGPSIGLLPSGVDGSASHIDYSQGPLQNTERPLDLAILGDGFFRVQTPQGERLTRDGTFHRDAAGNLVTADGFFVLGDNGPVHIGEGTPTIVEDGTVYLVGSTQPAGRIALARVDNVAALQREDYNLLNPANTAVQPMPAGTGVMKQGLIEQANVDAGGTMVGMMMALRGYEATQRSFRLQDETLQRTMEIGRV